MRGARKAPESSGRHLFRSGGIVRSRWAPYHFDMSMKSFLIRLSDEEREALRAQAAIESRSMQEVARLAVLARISSSDRRAGVAASLERIMVRDAELIDRLGK